MDSQSLPKPLPQVQPSGSTAKQQVVEQLKNATNVLVTVSSNPSVDQLAAAIGVTLVLNKLGKHATAVFSGEVPSTIEFLQPEKTIEKNTDSLRDFIIALDKAKADKLRYKVEDRFVKIFITPYHTSLNEKDLEFSQGDFNVDTVVALGVKKQQELDQAVTAHGRILHDATVISVNHQTGADVGMVNLNEPDASSLCEIMVGISESLKTDQTEVFDGQIATAFLSGIVAATDRFSNQNTTPQTMSTAARLMKAGANQQLIATKLEEPKPLPQEPPKPKPKEKPPEPPAPKPAPPPAPKPPAPSTEGSLVIPHEANKFGDTTYTEDEGYDDIDKIHIDDEGTLRRLKELQAQQAAAFNERKVINPPSTEPKLSANTEPEHLDPSTDPLTLPPITPPMLHRNAAPPLSAPNTVGGQANDEQTLTELEESVHSPHSRAQVDQDNQTYEAYAPAEQTGLPPQLVGVDPGLPADKTAGDPNPGAPPTVPPPMYTPPTGPANATNPDSSGVPL